MATETNLSFKDKEFTFKGEPLRLFSGAIHYFRVVPEYWQDRLQKLKACGFNTVETYVPWNLHEPRPGHFKNDGILDLRKFIQIAADLDLYVIFRPGPYICSEWDFGGLPSWLLADPEMKVRSNYNGYQKAVERYFTWLLPQVLDLQSTQGGPIIAVQVENEYGSFSFDPAHLVWLRDLLWRSGVTELLVTSDNETCARGIRQLLEQKEGGGDGTSSCSEAEVDLFHIPGVLPTANGMTVFEVSAVFKEIRRDSGKSQETEALTGVNGKPESRPLMVMEMWSGWFDYWGAPIHETTTAESLEETVQYAFSQGSSINLYMFHGGTNFGFMNGALQLPPDDPKVDNPSDPDDYPYRPDVTSYDYDAPIAEDGCVTGKYLRLRQLVLEERNKLKEAGFTTLQPVPDVPHGNQRALCPLVVEGWAGDGLEMLPWDDLLATVTKRAEESGDPKWMESYSYPGGDVQSYGYIVYRKSIETKMESDVKLSFTGRIRDKGTVLVNGAHRACVDSSTKDTVVCFSTKVEANKPLVMDLVVENQGRVNYTTSDYQTRLNTQRKGISGPVALDGKPLQGWDILALDFEGDFLERVMGSGQWCSFEKPKNGASNERPALYRGTVKVTGKPRDYFVRMEGWHKGVVFVNGFNLGRYSENGPTRSLYVPGPILKEGENQVIVFEEKAAGGQIIFGIEPHLG